MAPARPDGWADRKRDVRELEPPVPAWHIQRAGRGNTAAWCLVTAWGRVPGGWVGWIEPDAGGERGWCPADELFPTAGGRRQRERLEQAGLGHRARRRPDRWRDGMTDVREHDPTPVIASDRGQQFYAHLTAWGRIRDGWVGWIEEATGTDTPGRRGWHHADELERV